MSAPPRPTPTLPHSGPSSHPPQPTQPHQQPPQLQQQFPQRQIDPRTYFSQHTHDEDFLTADPSLPISPAQGITPQVTTQQDTFHLAQTPIEIKFVNTISTPGAIFYPSQQDFTKLNSVITNHVTGTGVDIGDDSEEDGTVFSRKSGKNVIDLKNNNDKNGDNSLDLINTNDTDSSDDENNTTESKYYDNNDIKLNQPTQIRTFHTGSVSLKLPIDNNHTTHPSPDLALHHFHINTHNEPDAVAAMTMMKTVAADNVGEFQMSTSSEIFTGKDLDTIKTALNNPLGYLLGQGELGNSQFDQNVKKITIIIILIIVIVLKLLMMKFLKKHKTNKKN